QVTSALAPGRYRMRRRGEPAGAGASLLVQADREPGQVVRWGADGAPAPLEVGPGPSFALTAGAEPVTFVIEELEWDADALQPVHLFSLQQFRDLFSEEYLAAGVKLNIGE